MSRFSPFTEEQLQLFIRERDYLIRDYDVFMQELTKLAREFGYDKPEDFSETAKILNRERKEFNDELNSMNKLIWQGGLIFKDKDKDKDKDRDKDKDKGKGKDKGKDKGD